MTTLATKSFTDLVRNMVTAVQAKSRALLDLTEGSALLAVTEAVSGVCLWLQAMVLQVLMLTRAATSKGSDLDSWMADFDLYRLAASQASGQVVFSRFTPTNQAIVPIGATVQTGDGAQSFAVTVDPTNSAYNSTLNAYVIAPGTTSVNVPVQALIGGAAGNVLANTITTITQALPGVDTVNNASAFLNGLDAEKDDAFYARFKLYIAGLSKGTDAAVRSAVAAVQQGLQEKTVEDEDYSGADDPGYFYVVVDDGSGTPSTNLINAVGSAVEKVRALGIRFSVFPPVVETANVSMLIASAAGFDHPKVVGAVGVAVTNFLNSLPLGAGLPYTQLSSIAYSVPGVSNVTNVLLNSGTADMGATNKQVIKAGNVSVS